ncbi:MAG TPA: glutamine--fructose-6-phosphate aminotransferase, partial [Rhodoblastus sp.]|nr:glutamine--fructose-6-phosphate aminotransferase [Rhodoblastus sp.]
LEKTVSNVQEVAARGGRIVLIGDEEAQTELATELAGAVLLKPMASDFAAIVYAIPVQLLAYHAAVFMGKDVDQPRNLAKSVTVE